MTKLKKLVLAILLSVFLCSGALLPAVNASADVAVGVDISIGAPPPPPQYYFWWSGAYAVPGGVDVTYYSPGFWSMSVDAYGNCVPYGAYAPIWYMAPAGPAVIVSPCFAFVSNPYWYHNNGVIIWGPAPPPPMPGPHPWGPYGPRPWPGPGPHFWPGPGPMPPGPYPGPHPWPGPHNWPPNPGPYHPGPHPGPMPGPHPGPQPWPGPHPYPGPHPGPTPQPYPGPHPGPGPQPYPGPHPGPQPGPLYQHDNNQSWQQPRSNDRGAGHDLGGGGGDQPIFIQRR